MSSQLENAGSVKQKMLRPRRPARGRQHVHLEKLAETVFRTCAKSRYDMNLQVPDVSASGQPQKKCFDELPELCLCILTAGGGNHGLVVFDGAVVDALIEQQTLGRVAAAPRGDRPVTQIDARLSMEFATMILDEIGRGLALEGLTEMVEMTVTHPEFDRENLSLTLSEETYDVLRVELDLGPGVKTGFVQVWYPGQGTAASVAPSSGATMGSLVAADPELSKMLGEIRAELSADLHGIKLPLTEFIALEPGKMIDLPPDILSQVTLSDRQGHAIANARLGQLNGHSALRILWLDGQEPEADAPDGDAFAGPEDAGLSLGDAPAALPDLPMEGGDGLPELEMGGMDLGMDAAEDAPQIDLDAGFGGGEALPDFPSDLGGDIGGDLGGEDADALPEMDFPAMAPMDIAGEGDEEAASDDGFPMMAAPISLD